MVTEQLKHWDINFFITMCSNHNNLLYINTYSKYVKCFSFTCITVKQSHYRSRQTQRLPGVWGSQISRQSSHEGRKIVSPTHRPPLFPRKYSWYSFLLRGWVDPRAIVRPEGLCQWKIPTTLGNRTRNLRSCSAVPQPPVPQRDPLLPVGCIIYVLNWISLPYNSWFLAVYYLIPLRHKQ